MNQEQDPQDRAAAQLRALFDVALQDEPASTVSALSVIQAAKRQQSTDYDQAEQARRKRNSWLRGGLVAAAVVALGAILVPVLFRGSTSSTASSSSPSSSSADLSAPAAVAGAAGAGRPDTPARGSSAAAPSAESSSAAGAGSVGSGGPSSSAASSAAGAATRTSAVSSGGALPGATAGQSRDAIDPAASSAASGSAAETSGSTAPLAPTPTGPSCRLADAGVIAAVQPVLPAGTSMVARPTAGCAAFGDESGLRSVTFPALTPDGAVITVRISPAPPGACRAAAGCLPISGHSDSFVTGCGQGCSSVWLYGDGYEVFVGSESPGVTATTTGLPTGQLLPIAQAALAAVG